MNKKDYAIKFYLIGKVIVVEATKQYILDIMNIIKNEQYVKFIPMENHHINVANILSIEYIKKTKHKSNVKIKLIPIYDDNTDSIIDFKEKT